MLPCQGDGSDARDAVSCRPILSCTGQTMPHEISARTASRIISEAFAPLHCVAEPFDYDKFVRFRVFDTNDESLLRMEKLTATDYGSVSSLESIIDHARSNLTRRGFELSSWQMPAVA